MLERNHSFQGSRILLRNFLHHHRDDYEKLISHEEVFPYMVDHGPLSKNQIEVQFHRMIESRDPLYLAIETLEDSKLIGYIGIFNLQKETPVLSYAVNPQYQQKGIATEALSVLFKGLEGSFYGVIARTHLDNIKSQKLLEKLSFTLCGEVLWNGDKRKEYILIFDTKS